jgi:preprotein translocase subunit SecA
VVLDKVLTKVFGTANERLLKRLWPVVAEINALE